MMDFHPIDFLFAKKIYPESSQEICLFLANLLKSAREGHMYVPATDCKEDLPPRLFDTMLVKDKERIYLRRNWECESTFIQHLKRLKTQRPHLLIPIDVLKLKVKELSLNQEQQSALLKAAQNCLTLITGGPGTGKTYTATSLIRCFFEMGIKNIAVAAPTGKATANIRNSLENLSQHCTFNTLHALLKKERTLADLVIVDEGSMIDAEKMAALFGAIKEGARLILLGDKNQLPPIESGNFFADLAHDQNLGIELTHCLRCEFQEIIDRANLVKQGHLIPFQPLPDIKSLINMILKTKSHVLTPLRKGVYGVEYLNQMLHQEHTRAGKKEIPIMITINDPSQNLFNGDSGLLITEEKKAYFSGGRVISEYQLPHYEYAYAVSVHKSQGSEYDNTLILLPKGSEVFGREMLYTAITRTKKQMILLSEAEVLAQTVKTHYRRRSAIIDNLFC